jgi:hypothetical protein
MAVLPSTPLSLDAAALPSTRPPSGPRLMYGLTRNEILRLKELAAHLKIHGKQASDSLA